VSGDEEPGGPAWTVLAPAGHRFEFVDLDADGTETARATLTAAELPALVATRVRTRWVWADAAHAYGRMLVAGARVARAWDLRLCRRILRSAVDPDGHGALGPYDAWDGEAAPAQDEGLFPLQTGHAPTTDEAVVELRRQLAALGGAPDRGRLRMLLHGESAGALVSEEMHAAGLPWDAAVHGRILTEQLGPRPAGGGVPARMAELAEEVRAALGDPSAILDSPPKLLRALRRAGLPVASTSKWELREYEHPVIEPLLTYKRLARLLTANGWAWLDEWVQGGRFRPVYVPGGVVTGRWASSGGGALQIPKLLRPAVRPDAGWVIVDADAAQLEPRVLAGMSRDLALAAAARGRDLYAGVVASGAVATREEAKYAMLGAMYGGTKGDSGRLVPRLRRAYPAAMAVVDGAAAEGERGGTVRTWLGRTSPAPDAAWLALSSDAGAEGAPPALRDLARRAAGDRGRFTRNFVVQGTAAEWALCWLAGIRSRLHAMGEATGPRAERSGPVFAARPHLVFFLHDEVMVHTPAEHADAVVAAVQDAAAEAGRLLFGTFPVDFPLDVDIIGTARAD